MRCKSITFVFSMLNSFLIIIFSSLYSVKGPNVESITVNSILPIVSFSFDDDGLSQLNGNRKQVVSNANTKFFIIFPLSSIYSIEEFKQLSEFLYGSQIKLRTNDN